MKELDPTIKFLFLCSLGILTIVGGFLYVLVGHELVLFTAVLGWFIILW